MPLCRLVCVALAAVVLSAQTGPNSGPTPQPLWPSGSVPLAQGTADLDTPTLTAYVPPKEKAVGTAVVVFPGGGYGALAMDHEGRQIAQWLNGRGVAAFVLKYRLGPRYRHPVPMTDAQRAIRTVRARATEFNVRPERVGVWGFSAGGHLASTVGTHFDDGNTSATDAVDRQSSRPDFLVLCYPVVTFQDPYAHKGSRRNLLGDSPSAELVANLSNETQVTARTPPTFLFHTDEDPVVSENSVQFYLALRKAKVPAEMHIYEKGRHGLGLAWAEDAVSSWPDRLHDWLRLRGLLERPQ